MDVNASSFPHHLLGMLTAISEANFISFDLEFSGVPTRTPGKLYKTGRRTVEDRYQELKAAAEKYQILQVGITCARYDFLEDKYVLRPYNINISPMIDERLQLERDFAFQGSAVAFLLRNGFQMDVPFTQGVQYLSRDEAELAKQVAYDRLDKKNVFQDLQLKETDVESLDFLRRVREEIVKWQASSSLSLEITTHTGLKEKPATPAISRFEKRLVYELVRAEFPSLVATGRADYMKIIVYDAEREADNTRRSKNRVKESIVKQTGFRWVVEAMCQGNMDSIDPIYFARNASGMVIAADLVAVNARFRRALMRIQDQQAVLVGHNMFADLVYFYNTFIGKLPDTLQEFCAAIHDLFPRIVDTKYLATHDGGDLNVSPTLQEIAEGLEAQELPDIVTHQDHSKYHAMRAFHEAGYDSVLTATVMLRLSTKLDAELRAESDSDVSFKTAKTDQDDAMLDGREHVQEAVPLPPIDEPKQSKKKKKKRGAKGPESRFTSRNMFEGLLSGDGNAGSEETEGFGKVEQPQNISIIGERDWVSEPPPQGGSVSGLIETIQRKPMEMMPDFGSEFWHRFGNKLRVFGTEETMLKIADWKNPPRAI